MKTNLLTTIKEQAEAQGYKYIYGEGRYLELGLSQLDLSGGAICLMFKVLRPRMVIENKMWNGELDYPVKMFLFRKFEQSSTSSLNETLEQKFEYRLDELQTELLRFISILTQCNNEMELIDPNMEPVTDVFSANVDGWDFECTLRLTNQYPT